jgi:hypothetical protein
MYKFSIPYFYYIFVPISHIYNPAMTKSNQNLKASKYHIKYMFKVSIPTLSNLKKKFKKIP